MNSGVKEPGLKLTQARSSRVWMSNTRVRCSLEGRLRRGRKHSVYKSAKRKTVFSVGQWENVQPAALAGGGSRREGRAGERPDHLSGGSGRGSGPWVGAGESQGGKAPAGLVVLPHIGVPKPHSHALQELLQLGEVFFLVITRQVCGCCPEGGSSPGLDQAGQGSSPRGKWEDSAGLGVGMLPFS